MDSLRQLYQTNNSYFTKIAIDDEAIKCLRGESETEVTNRIKSHRKNNIPLENAILKSLFVESPYWRFLMKKDMTETDILNFQVKKQRGHITQYVTPMAGILALKYHKEPKKDDGHPSKFWNRLRQSFYRSTNDDYMDEFLDDAQRQVDPLIEYEWRVFVRKDNSLHVDGKQLEGIQIHKAILFFPTFPEYLW